MRGKKGKEKNYKARVAWVLRQRIANGGTLTDQERQWLDEYAASARVGRPLKDVPRPAIPPPPIGIVATHPPDPANGEGDFKIPPESALPPLNMGVPESEVEEKAPEPEFAHKENGEEPSWVSADSSPGPGEDESSNEGRAAADKYCQWLKRVNQEVAALGGVALPDELIDTLIHHCAKSSFTRLAKSYGETMSEGKQDFTVIAAAGISYGQRMYLQRKLQRTPKPEAASTAPAPKPPATERRLNLVPAPVETKRRFGFDG